MTLVELMVALAILGLTAALACSNIGPWLALSRASAAESGFWRAATPAQLLLDELAAGAIDPASRRVDAERAHFRALVPRLSSMPLDITLAITRDQNESRLSLRAEGLSVAESIVLESASPMRFVLREQVLFLEARQASTWRPIAVAEFPADAPFVCAFDPI
ncbi:MAG: pilus assembly FimT family protein, partial [Vitreimonas sp.]